MIHGRGGRTRRSHATALSTMLHETGEEISNTEELAQRGPRTGYYEDATHKFKRRVSTDGDGDVLTLLSADYLRGRRFGENGSSFPYTSCSLSPPSLESHKR